MTLSVIDAGGTIRQLSTTVNANDGGLAATHTLIDPINSTRQTINPFGSALVTSEGTKPTYGWSGILSMAQTAPTDVIVIPGSATKTGRIKRILIQGMHNTTSANAFVNLIRRSTANSGGTSTPAINPLKWDTANDPVPTITPILYTVNPTSTGTLVGMSGSRMFTITALNTSNVGSYVEWTFANRADKALILRGTSDFICINFGGSTFPSSTFLNWELELEEDNS